MLRATDGLVDTEGHVAWKVQQAIRPGQDAIIYGHGGAHKGGWATTMRQNNWVRTGERLRQAVEWPVLSTTEQERVDWILADFIAQHIARPPIDALFFGHARWRAARYLEPQYLKMSAQHFTPIFPSTTNGSSRLQRISTEANAHLTERFIA